jgi:hypothetical protein
VYACHQAVKVQELKFQMAVRDQVISEQRDVIANLWRIMESAGLGREQIVEIARQVHCCWLPHVLAQGTDLVYRAHVLWLGLKSLMALGFALVGWLALLGWLALVGWLALLGWPTV